VLLSLQLLSLARHKLPELRALFKGVLWTRLAVSSLVRQRRYAIKGQIRLARYQQTQKASFVLASFPWVSTSFAFNQVVFLRM
jgi:hypothetical protein